ncbi:RHS repeat domain-containing protein [Streptomyces sp. NPDC001903]|uniref:RHS repeat domain-containing protein n=1 Tax=Streptomyces sp. NPDC001903 TaxID=3364622 RepID=UPI0036892169
MPGATHAARLGGNSDTPAAKQPKAVPVKEVRTGGAKRADAAAAHSWDKQAKKSKWPAAGNAEVNLAEGGRAGSLPVSVSASKDAGKLKLSVANRDTAQRAGVDGLVLTVGRSDGKTDPVQAEVKVDYSSFRHAYGGDWAARLRLVELPACALTTPGEAKCRVQTPVPTKNDVKTGTLTAKTSAAMTARVMAATAGDDGPSGDYKATSLQPSGSWNGGGATGAFTWSHPVTVPSVPGGLEPSVALNYSSQAVDGRTSAANSQPSWIGDGWDWEPGFIERKYKSCNDDKTGGTNTAKVGDLCWFNDNATLSLGGKSTELVYEAGKGWVPQSDTGERVEKLTGATNGDNDGEHWKVTGTDGTQYYFGLNRLPGWKDGTTPTTNSAWTVPVFGNQSGEPCYNASFANGWCQQAWRWQLDYVVDVHGNAMAYYWNTEKNNYTRNVSETTGKGTTTPYIRSGWLDRIDYGLRDGAAYTGKPMAQVQFGVDERCLSGCGTFDANNAKNWPDVPFDLECKDGSTECKDRNSPTFWSRKRLTSITTKVLTGGQHKEVDTWNLAQDFPASGDGVSTPMWLKSIQRVAKAGDAPDITMPAVTFAGEQRANRVDKTGDGLAPFIRLRLYQITNETGGTIGVTYSQQDCTPTTLPNPDATNTTRCYPVKWVFEGETAKLDWFNKYVVTQVVEGDNLADSPDKVTSYSYLGGAAWSKSEDEFTKAEDRTYSIARGYERVQTRTGAANDAQTLEEKRFFRGLDGAAVKDSAGTDVTDRPEFAGMVRETIKYLGDDTSKLVSATSFTPWRSGAGNKRSRPGLPDLVSYKTGTEKDITRTTVTGGIRTTEVSRHFDDYGMPDWVSETGDKDKPGDEKCATTTYVRNTAAWILDKPSRVESVAVTCGSPVSRPGDVVEDIRTSYDGAAFGVAPTRGLSTKQERINGAGTAYTVVSSTNVADFDIYGRALKTADAYGKVTTTAYTPATGEVPSQAVVTNPKAQAATTVLEPLRGLAIQLTDANGKVTTSEFDAAGRLTKVWKPTRSAITYKDSPNFEFSYLVRSDGPTVITSKALTHDSQYEVSYSFLDGMLRQRQGQKRSPDGAGRLVSETFFDTHGRPWRTSGEFYASGAPEGVLVTGQQLNYPSSTDTEYDGAGRTTAVISKRFGQETKRSTTLYTGDTTTQIPPKGGVATTQIVDALGRTVEQKQYTDPGRMTFVRSTDLYDRRGKLARHTDPSGAEWSYEYDVRGRQVKMTDADKGVSTTTYDDGDRITDVQDARGVTLHTDFDELGRRTALKKGTNLLATWEYDTVAKGQVSKSVRYVGTNAYESSVLSYNSIYQPVRTRTVIPASEGALAGTYEWTSSYSPNTGQLLWTKHPAIGGLPAETVTPTLQAVTGALDGLGAGSDPIVSSSTYDHYGRLIVRKYGDFGQSLTTTNSYDEHTGFLTDSYLDRDVAPQRISDTHYTYDAVGNITSNATSYGQDAARTTDRQCFKLDAQRRITDAWTDKNAQCASAPSAAAVGGQNAYWTSYTFDAVGNRKTETQHATASGPATDTVRTYGAPTAGKHDLPKVTQTGTNPHDETFTYDASGNTATRKVGSAATQSFGWDDEGRLASIKEGATEKAGYVYDTDGQRLIRRDGTGTTLYLSYNTELHLKGGTVTGTRYYTFGGKSLAFRTGGKLTFTVSDHHDTGVTQVSADAQQVVRHRKTAPFGGQRGTPDAGWAGDKGFLGGPSDSTASTVHLGAREYDPVVGRFLSVDPVLDINDPQQTHGYTYGNNNPVTFSDPSGRMLIECREGLIKCRGGLPVLDDEPDDPGPGDSDSGSDEVDDMVAEVINIAFGKAPKGSKRKFFKVPAGEDRGVIRVTFFIHSEDAALGMLKGDNREYDLDPNASYRMSLVWDTKTGNCSFTVTASTTVPEKVYTADGVGPLAQLKEHTVPSKEIPAHDISIAKDPSTTPALNNTLIPVKTDSSDELIVSIEGLNSLLPVFDADATVRVAFLPDKSVVVNRHGDAYPDMEVVQYQPNQSPRFLAKDRMGSTTGLDSAPFWGNSRGNHKYWSDGKCVNTGGGCG